MNKVNSLSGINLMPQMTVAFMGWTSNIVIKKVVQVVDNDGFITDSKTKYIRKGILQPLSPEIIQNKPEGQRSWKWVQIHLQTKILDFENNDIIEINGTDYKVMQVNDYTLNNYVEYHVIKDYK